MILAAQVLGEAVARAVAMPLPGPVLGMIFMLALLLAAPRLVDQVRGVAQSLLANMSLLFVPAGTGVIGHVATLGGQTFAILVAILGSAVLAIATGALTFSLVARLTGSTDD